MDFLSLPPALHLNIMLRLMDKNVCCFWKLSCVSKTLQLVVQQAAAALQELDTDKNCKILKKPMFAKTAQRFLQALLQHVRDVRAARLRSAYWWMNDSAVTLLAVRCKALQELHLDFCQQVTANSIQVAAASGGLQQLRVLSLHGCGFVGQAPFLHQLPALEDLDLSQTSGISVEDVRAVVPHLRRLLMTSCDWAQDEVLSTGPGQQLRLEHLNISRTSITDAGLAQLEGCQQLRLLVVSTLNHNLWVDGRWSHDRLQALQQALPHLTIKHET